MIILMHVPESNNISFSDKNYQKTDMSNDSEAEAEQLLKGNPDVQAIFCVNDAVAKGLYAAMKKRELIPGKDIFVFGFGLEVFCEDFWCGGHV